MTERCAECGFVWDTQLDEGLRVIGELPARTGLVLQGMGPDAYRQPADGTWSANEYVWHLADVFRMSSEWLQDMCTRDHPTHYAVDWNEMAALRRYADMPLELAAWSLGRSCDLLGEVGSRVDPTRTCYYHDWRDITAGEVVGLLAHEAVHHLFDLERLAARKDASHAC
jgi:hypothetical protein